MICNETISSIFYGYHGGRPKISKDLERRGERPSTPIVDVVVSEQVSKQIVFETGSSDGFLGMSEVKRDETSTPLSRLPACVG